MQEKTARIRKRVYERMDLSNDLEDDDLKSVIEQCVMEESKVYMIPIREREVLEESVFNAIRKLDVLQELLEDDSITEIMINGSRDIFIERKGEIQRCDKTFETQERLEDITQKIAALSNKIVNASTPIVDTRLESGARVNIVLPPVAIDGPIITIRKFYEEPLTMEKLTDMGSISKEAADFLEKAVKAKYNIFISGSTGSGKTTFLNILSNYIPEKERVITIEDSAELQIRHVKNLVRLEARNANVEGKNAVTIRDLIRSSLRMRPDRIVVGEVRGEETLDMIQAMATGHDGSLSTGHGNSPKDMMSRLETMVLMGIDIPLAAVRQQLASSIDIIVHLGRLRDKSRRVMEIAEIVGISEGEVELNTLFKFKEEMESESEGEEKGEREKREKTRDREVTGIKGRLVRTDNKMVKTEKFATYGYRQEIIN